MPTKKPTKTPAKSAAAKKAPAKVTVEQKAKSFAKNVEKEAKVIGAESKEIGSKIGNRRESATTEERAFTILGILLLIFGLYVLKEMIV